MSWTSDVRAELAALDQRPRALRRFAWVVGGALLLLGAWLLRRHPAAGASALAAAAALLAAGWLAPAALRPLHRAWMGFAFASGWLVSRALLALLFFAALTPTALVARWRGKRFLERGPDPAAGTYWTQRPAGGARRYERMY